MSDRLRRIIAWWQIVCAALGLLVFAVAYLNWMPGGRVWLLQTLGPINTFAGSAFFSFAIAAGRALLRKEPWSAQACMLCQAVQIVYFAFLHGPQVQIAAGPFLGFTIASGSFKFSAGFYASFFLGTLIAGPAYQVSVNVIAAVWTTILFREWRRARAMPTAKILEAELARYLAQAPADPRAEYEGAKQHAVLPLFSDFVGCWALDMTGRLVFFSWQEPGTLELVSEQRAQGGGARVALAVGSVRYPALAGIRPVRPRDAVPCTSCDGSGRIAGAPENIMCACGSLGWLPRL